MPDLDGLGVLARLREAGIGVSGDRADRPWRHRQCGVGDARRRRRFRGQAGRRRTAAGEPCATRSMRARSKANSPASSAAAPARSASRTSSPQPAHARRAAHGREGRGLDHPGADRRRIRRRQGADRARHPRHRRAPRQAVHRGQLRRDPGEPRRDRSCSATRRARSPARPSATSASSSRPPAARCSSTRSANCRPPRRSSCCAPSRRARSSRSARASRSRSTCGSSRPPTAT